VPPEQYDEGRAVNQTFEPIELLYRRVHPEELNALGEVDPNSIRCVKFTKDERESPSVVRERYAKPEDVLHRDCCDQRDKSDHLIYKIRVADLPAGILAQNGEARDTRIFNFVPSHQPEKTCYAHSVVRSTLQGDLSRAYAKPSPTARDQFKVEFARALKRHING
jgi:hypothetical protein